jgi:outer membrane protein TolC
MTNKIKTAMKARDINNARKMLRLLSSFLLVAFLVAPAAYGQVMLDDCHAKARSNFPLIKQYELIDKTKENTLSKANKGYLPKLDVSVIGGIISGLPSFSPPGTESSSSADFNMISVLQLNQVLWDGGITRAKKEIATASVEMEMADLEVSLYALEERVNNLFFGILLIDEQVKQMEILKSTMQRNLNRVEIAVENGTAFKSDIDEIKVEVINIDQKMEELISNRSAYINVLAAMIGEEIVDNATFVKPVLDKSFQTLENNRPELRLFQNRENLIEAQSAIDKSMLYPRVGLLGFATFIQPGVDFGASTLNNIFVGGLSINWRLGALYTNGNNKKLTKINLQKVAVQRETFLFNNNLELTQTSLEMDKYKVMLEQDREILELKGSIKDAYDVKYENGVATMSELLTKTNDESVAQQNLIVHEIQYLMKAYQYLNKSGN